VFLFNILPDVAALQLDVQQVVIITALHGTCAGVDWPFTGLVLLADASSALQETC
jgi:hypothetical protein